MFEDYEPRKKIPYICYISQVKVISTHDNNTINVRVAYGYTNIYMYNTMYVIT